MTVPARSELRSVAVQVASEAAEVVATMRKRAVTNTRTKSSLTDVVTVADTEAEGLIRTRLAQLRPGDVVLGEEGGGSREAVADVLRWVVDPIDGTVNYLYGLPWYAVSVAVADGAETVAGAVVEPASGRVWSAEAGGGATLDDQPLRVSAAERLDLALISTGFSYLADRRARQGRLAAAMLSQVRDIRRCGSAALDLCAVAAGWVDGFYEHGINLWDWAAGALIAQEAGAVVHPPSADSRYGNAIVAAAPGIAEELRRTLIDLGAVEVE
jgi:myo-inositol-1(or 4)-monophosphatase